MAAKLPIRKSSFLASWTTYSCPKSLPEVTQVYLPCFDFEAEWVEPLGFNSARGWFLVFEGTCLSLFVGEMVGSSAELRPYLCAFTSWGVCGERRGGLGYAHGTTENGAPSMARTLANFSLCSSFSPSRVLLWRGGKGSTSRPYSTAALSVKNM